MAEWCDVGALVEDEKQRRVKGIAGLGGALVGGCDDLLDEGREERLEPALFVGRPTEVGGVRAPVEESACLEVACEGGDFDKCVAEDAAYCQAVAPAYTDVHATACDDAYTNMTCHDWHQGN